MVKLRFLILGTFFVAAGGILYEIFLGALGSYIFGDSVKIFSLTAGVYMFCMGIGAFSIRHDTPNPLKKLLLVEVALILLHLMGPLLIWNFFIAGAGAGISFWAVLSLSGILVGTEIPLVLGLTRETEGSSDARINQILAADYFGALVASIFFGFYLLPVVGLIGSSAVAAIFEAVGAILLISACFRKGQKISWTVTAFLVLGAVSVSCLLMSKKIQQRLESVFFQSLQDGAELMKSEWTGFSHVSVVAYTAPTNLREILLVLDRQFQWSTGVGLEQYHEALTVPAIEAFREAHQNAVPKKVLILGGGDALAAHTMRKIYDVDSITIVDIDPRISELALEIPRWREAGGNAVLDPHVRLIHDDAFSYVRKMPANEIYDMVVFDLPDPKSAALARFFTPFFMQALSPHLEPHGVISIQASSDPHRTLGKIRYVCSLLNLLESSGFESEAITGDQMDFFVVAARDGLRFPASGKVLPGKIFRDSKLIAEYRVDPLGYFESSQCKSEPVSTLLSPKLLDL